MKRSKKAGIGLLCLCICLICLCAGVTIFMKKRAGEIGI